MTFSVLLFWISTATVALGVPAGVYVGKNGEVGASWGGYSASAGLGGLVGGSGTRGGLHAEAGTPDGHFAAAGLGGSVSGDGANKGGIYSVAGGPGVSSGGVSSSQASSSASSSATSGAHAGSSANHINGHHNNKPQGTFFDDIFNIPISVLGAVNQYLNNKNGNGGRLPLRRKAGRGAAVHGTAVQGHVKPHHHNKQPNAASSSFSSSNAGASVDTTGNSNAGSFSQASSSSNSQAIVAGGAVSSAGSSATSGAASGGIDNNIYHGQKRPGNYNDIFNIPISVLGAVNRLLNNGR